MTQTELLKKALDMNGVEYELNVCMEECAELIQAISKCRRYGCEEKNREHLIEEIADTSIIIETLKTIYNIESEEIEETINRKLNRLIDRLARKLNQSIKQLAQQENN